MARPKKAIEPEEMAAILAHGDKHGDPAAAKWGKCSVRTLKRYRAAMKAGQMPELSRLVTEQKRAAIGQVQDLLTETYEKALRRLQEVLPQATPTETIKAVKELGELNLTRKALDGTELNPGEGEAPAVDTEGEDVPGSPSSGKEAGGGAARPRPPRVH